jgi:hypothetical protein
MTYLVFANIQNSSYDNKMYLFFTLWILFNFNELR